MTQEQIRTELAALARVITAELGKKYPVSANARRVWPVPTLRRSRAGWPAWKRGRQSEGGQRSRVLWTEYSEAGRPGGGGWAAMTRWHTIEERASHTDSRGLKSTSCTFCACASASRRRGHMLRADCDKHCSNVMERGTMAACAAVAAAQPLTPVPARPWRCNAAGCFRPLRRHGWVEVSAVGAAAAAVAAVVAATAAADARLLPLNLQTGRLGRTYMQGRARPGRARACSLAGG